MDFFNAVKLAQKKFLASFGTVHIVSHLDCDGICSAAIIMQTLKTLGRNYTLELLPQLSYEKIKELEKIPEETILFTDLGSAHLGAIEETINKQIFILDHHKPNKSVSKKNITHVNPHNYGIDGGLEISGSGVAYYFSKELVTESLADFAVIGAIGDSQEKGNFKGLNNEILNESVQKGLVNVKKDLRFFGLYSKPLHKLLTLSYDTYIPGITGNEHAAINFIKALGIVLKKENKWVTYPELNPEEKEKFKEAIIKKRATLNSPDDIFCMAYTSSKGTGSFFDLRETSTILNACGRLGKGKLGCEALLGDIDKKKQAEEILNTYRGKITDALAWYNKNKNTFVRQKNFLIINAQSNIRSTMVGTLASILTRSKFVPEGTVVIILGREGNGLVKVSARVFGNKNIDLRKILFNTMKIINGESGGHRNAAGAVFKEKYEEKFIDEIKQILSKECS